jgi:hypothetical protein
MSALHEKLVAECHCQQSAQMTEVSSMCIARHVSPLPNVLFMQAVDPINMQAKLRLEPV